MIARLPGQNPWMIRPGAPGLGAPGIGASPFQMRPGPDQQMGQAQMPMGRPVFGSFKKGGKVKKTGNYKLHKGEKVISVAQLARAK